MAEWMGLGRDGITTVLAIAEIGAIAGTFAGGQLTDRIGYLKTLTILYLAQIAILLMFSTLPIPFWVLLVMIIVWNTFGWSFMVAQQVHLISLATAQTRVLLALNADSIYIGSAVGPAGAAG